MHVLTNNAAELPKCKYSYNITRRILSDLERGAGQDELRQSGFVAIYTRERLKRSSDCGKYINIRMKSIFRSVFLKKAGMVKRYPYVANNGLLLPVAWLHRILNFLMADPEKKKNLNIILTPGWVAK